MKIAVCLKPVRTELVYTNNKNTDKFVINPYDLLALEYVLGLKKSYDCEIITVCMGPASCEFLAVKVLAMGCDEVILLKDDKFAGSDTVATSYILSQAIRKIGDVDMIICGEKTVDGETGQVAGGICERMKFYCVYNVNGILNLGEENVDLIRKDGNHLVNMKVRLPAVISFNDFKIAQPDITLLKLKKAKKKGVLIWDAKSIDADIAKCGAQGSKTKVLEVGNKLGRKNKEIVQGNLSQKASAVLNIISMESNKIV